MQKPDAIIFDWDDTIVDTWQVVRAAINTTLESFGHPPWDEDEARKRIGPPARVLFSGLFGEDQWQAADKIYIEAYEKGIVGHIRLHANAVETLQLLAAHDIPLAVVSTKRGHLLRQEAAHLGLDRYFITLVGAGDAHRDKPDAAAVELALKDSGITPSKNVWFIGDSATDMLSAANAGLTPILIETKPPSDAALAQHPPKYRVKNHQELIDFIDKNFGATTGAKPAFPAPKR